MGCDFEVGQSCDCFCQTGQPLYIVFSSVSEIHNSKISKIRITAFTSSTFVRLNEIMHIHYLDQCWTLSKCEVNVNYC